MEIQPKVAFGTLTGMAIGGLLAGEACSRLYTLINPLHAAVFGVASAITAFVFHKGVQWLYQGDYQKIPAPLKVMMNLGVATLVTGALASDCFGIHFTISAALKIIAGSAIVGGIGGSVGKYLSTEMSQEVRA